MTSLQIELVGEGFELVGHPSAAAALEWRSFGRRARCWPVEGLLVGTRVMAMVRRLPFAFTETILRLH